MKRILSKLYPIIRVFVFMGLVGCGSIQTVNGVRIPKDKPNTKNYILSGVIGFVFSYYLGTEVLPQKNK